MSGNIRDQIDKLTAIIKSSVGRTKTAIPHSGDQEPPTEKNSRDMKYERLGEMILKMQDGQLERKYALRLAKWLLSDERALRHYVEFNQISAMLRAIYNNKQKKTTEDLVLARQ